MRSKSIDTYLKQILDIWLCVSIHFDAFRSDPRAYLTATKWWIKRRRVRARGQFALLLSRSPKAYHLWVLRQEREAKASAPSNASPPIVALVDTRRTFDRKDLDATLDSLESEGLPALLIGSPETPDLAAAAARIDWSSAPWLLALAVGDRLEKGAVTAYRDVMQEPGIRLVYADDDLLVRGRRHIPYFKPDWNAELFRHYDFISGACIQRATRSDLMAVAHDADWADQLTARLAAEGRPVHLRRMLHHRVRRQAIRVPVAPMDASAALPPVSIIVPTRNGVDLLRTCLAGVAATDYPEVEVIVMDNDSDDPDTLAYLDALDPARHRVIRHGGAFNYSAINNHAVAEARGRLLCLLNNDIEITDPRWLATMVAQALRGDVGAVGARLLYPDGRIQHAGVAIGIGNAAGHAHRFLRCDEEGYFHRHNLPQFTTAVTAACLVVMRERFLAVGGLDEQNFPIAFNDVDLCLRLNQRGWQSLYEPRATLMHHESVSRGHDLDPVGAARFAGELAALKRIWKTDELFDPFHHPQLSRASEQFVVAL